MINRRSFLVVSGSGAAGGVLGFWTTTLNWRDAVAFVDSIGVNVHFGQTHTPSVTAFEGVLHGLSTLGVRHLRDDLGSDVALGRDGPQLARIRAAAAAGFRLCLMFYDGVAGRFRTPPEIAPRVFEWCDGAVDAFEGGNEPLLSAQPDGAQVSASHQRSLYASVKASADLSDTFVIGPSYIQRQIALAPDLSDAVDFGNVHPYPGYEHPETSSPAGLARHLLEVRRIYGSRPVVATEVGYHTAMMSPSGHLPVPEGIKARYLPRLLLKYFKAGVSRTYIYEAVSSFVSSDQNAESRFGLLGFDLSPTPAFHAVRNLIEVFRPKGRARTALPLDIGIDTAPGDMECLGFVRGDGARVLAVWREREGWNGLRRAWVAPEQSPLVLRLHGRVGSVAAMRFGDDGSMETRRLDLRDGRIEMAVDDHLTLLVLT